ncbi:hypothetical protein EV175_006207 [Coemansia sp. RSA 1933]|nr:hypothetical protein EV175_006207 [Coemansia sp. RSA 1933]
MALFLTGYVSAVARRSEYDGALVRRQGNLDSASAVSSTSSVWRAYACMVPFTASDGTPLLMLFGGSNNVDAGNPVSVAGSGVSNLDIFDIKNSKWYAPQTANAPAKGPVLPGCGAKQDSIWAYDPHYGVTDEQATPISLLDSEHWSWSSPTEQGQLPVTRFGAAFAYVPTSDQFYMHGGIPLSDANNEADDPPGIANNLDILSPSDVSWGYASNGPARKFHSLCYIKSIDSIILFGGSDQNVASYNDVKSYSMNSSSWRYALDVDGDTPSERILHSAVCTEDSMLVFGGTNAVGDAPSDSAVWVLKANNESSFTWSVAPIASSSLGEGPAARFGHSVSLYNNSMYIYGGIGPSGQDETIYKLDVTKWEWSQTTPGSSSTSDGGNSAKTHVLIAAVVSSVLGIICAGIATFVIYRWNRRHGSMQENRGTQVVDSEALDVGEYTSIDGDAMINGEELKDTVGTDGYLGEMSKQAMTFNARGARGNDDYAKQYEDANNLLMLSNSGSTAARDKMNSDIVTNNYMPPPHKNPSFESSSSRSSAGSAASSPNIEPHRRFEMH